MSRRIVDFSSTASLYDRRHGRFIPEDYLDVLLAGAALEPPARVLDIAAGTGRIAVPFARRGFQVIGVDRSPPMLEELRKKDERGLVETVTADVADLAFPDHSFDVVILAKLLYLVPEWRTMLAEAMRILRPNGVLLHEWANGEADEPWVLIREKARALFEEAGVAEPFHPGARSEKQVDDELLSGGGRAEQIILGTGTETVSPGEFLERIKSGEISYIWDVPEDIREKCLPVLAQWVVEQFDNLDERDPFPRRVRWTAWRFE